MGQRTLYGEDLALLRGLERAPRCPQTTKIATSTRSARSNAKRCVAVCASFAAAISDGRGERIRTSDLLNPIPPRLFLSVALSYAEFGKSGTYGSKCFAECSLVPLSWHTNWHTDRALHNSRVTA